MDIVFSESLGCDFFEKKFTRLNIRSLLSDFKTVPKCSFSNSTMDYSHKEGVGFYYDENDGLSGVEVYYLFGGFVIYGENVLGFDVHKLKKILIDNNIDFDEIYGESEIILNKNRVIFFIPKLEEEKDSAKVESVYISKIETNIEVNSKTNIET